MMPKVLIVILLSFVCGSSFAQSGPITEKQLAEITQTLKSVLDENHKLSSRNEELNARLEELNKKVSGMQEKSSGNSNDIESLKKEQSRLAKENERLSKIIENFKNELDGVIEKKGQTSAANDADFSKMDTRQKAEMATQKMEIVKQGSAQVYFDMGQEAFESGRYPEAIELFQKHLDMMPDSSNRAEVVDRIEEAKRLMR